MQGTRLYVLIAFLSTAFTLVLADEGHAQEPQGVTVDVSDELQTAQQVLATDQLKKALQYTEQSRDETIQEFLRVCNAFFSWSVASTCWAICNSLECIDCVAEYGLHSGSGG